MGPRSMRRQAAKEARATSGGKVLRRVGDRVIEVDAMPNPTVPPGTPIEDDQAPKDLEARLAEMRSLSQKIVLLLIDAQLTIDLAARRDDDHATQVVYLRAVERHLTSMLTLAEQLVQAIEVFMVQPPRRG